MYHMLGKCVFGFSRKIEPLLELKKNKIFNIGIWGKRMREKFASVRV